MPKALTKRQIKRRSRREQRRIFAAVKHDRPLTISASESLQILAADEGGGQVTTKFTVVAYTGSKLRPGDMI